MFKLLIFEVRYSIEARYSIPHSSMNPIHEFRPFQNMAVISLKSVSAQQSGAAAHQLCNLYLRPLGQLPATPLARVGNAVLTQFHFLCGDSIFSFTNVRITLPDGNQGNSWSSC